jgi:hypothetical protein
MVRNCVRALALVAIASLLASTAFAQPPGGRRGGAGGGFGLGGGNDLSKLMRQDVRAALDLDDDQVAKAQEAMQAWNEEYGFGGGRGRRGGDGGEFNIEEFQARQAEGRKAATAKAKEILLPQQFKRFEQISLQLDLAGVGGGGGGGGGFGGGFGGGGGGGLPPGGGLLNPRVAELLSISDEQREKLMAMAEEVNKRRAEKVAKADEEARKEYMAALTPDQQKKLEEAIGEKFEIQQQQGGRRGGGRGGRGNRGNQN